MKSVGRILISFAMLFAAFACYFLGAPSGGIFFLFLGAIFEGLFWFGILGRKRKKSFT
ncbi:hypothetical protein [Litoribacillus peritrichatus]|uniref:hypothetical protein n=1 Tax=Litoribacillus peritrichatus TaxID=718191 RepID=UPI0031D3A4F1